MKRKRTLILVMAGVLLALCIEGTASDQGTGMVEVELQKADGTPVKKQVEKPRHGGTFRQVWTRDALYFEEYFGLLTWATTATQTNESLLQGDWSKGPTGTNEVSFMYPTAPWPHVVGGLAESWELLAPDTAIFHIRKGVHWHDKPPTNGRQMDANDVAWSLKRLCFESPTSYHGKGYEGAWVSIEATDQWTVKVVFKPEKLAGAFEFISFYTYIWPPDPVKKYGDMNDWKNSCGTGPFMLTDYVSGSSATFTRNINYWMKNPIHTEDQLPYIDTLKYMIIPDHSTRLAAIRTGKVDILNLEAGITWEEADHLKETNPELRSVEFPNGQCGLLHWRVDKPELPWNNKAVRHALSLAVDQKAILDSIYGGHGHLFAWPIMPTAEWSDIYIPLENLPQATRELFEHHPEKAKKLLAEAGYPKGFRCKVTCHEGQVDILSIIKDFWAQIGVQLDLEVKEYGVFTSMGTNHTFEQMYMFSGYAPAPFKFTRLDPVQIYNMSRVDDPVINEAYRKISLSYFDKPNMRKIYKEVLPYIVDQAYMLVLPANNHFTIWQPWVKGYNGECEVGYRGAYMQYPKYLWVDEDIKSKMGKK